MWMQYGVPIEFEWQLIAHIRTMEGALLDKGASYPMVVGDLPQRWGKTPTLGPRIFNVFLQKYDYTGK